MSELRWHPMLNEWVITATHRQDRTFFPPDDYCPLCPTHPGGFPTEIPLEHYDIAVFENKFPSLRTGTAPAIEGTDYSPVKPSDGVCEVVVYTSDHHSTLAQQPVERIEALIDVWIDRFRELGARPEVEYVFMFENKGKEIGVTLSHPHGQIYAYPYIPPVVQTELESSKKWRDEHDSCLLCHIVDEEIRSGVRIVAQNENWAAFIPFFARYPYEVYIAPINHRGSLLEFNSEDKIGFAQMLKTVLTKFDKLFGFSLPYIMAMHQTPSSAGNWDHYHFHVEFYPPYRTKEKLKYLAGSEAGAGAFINDTLPEVTAKTLRDL